MAYFPSVYALAFYITSMLSVFLGVDVLIQNPKGRLNKHFFAMTLVLFVWAFGFAMSIIASSAESALFWRRFSAMGRTLIHAFLLYMIIILTSRDGQARKLKYYLLYIPAFIALYVFALSPSLSVQQYSFVYRFTGWTNITVNNIFYTLFHVYYSIYMLGNFALIIRWRKGEPQNKKKARILFAAFLATLIIGLITDLLLDIIFKSGTPHLGAIPSIIPLISIFYLTKKDNLLKEETEKDWEVILNSESRRKLYVSIAYLYLAAGAINFTQYFLRFLLHSESDIRLVILSSIIFFTASIFLLLVQFIKKPGIRDVIVLIITQLSIPAITLCYLPTASMTIWVIPIVFFIVTLVFETRIPVFLTMIIGIITQLVVWALAPEGPILLDEIDYLLRAAIIIVAFGMGLVINRIYIKKLKENIYQTKFQKMISDISFRFLNADASDYESNIFSFLANIADFLNVDKACLFRINSEKDSSGIICEWERKCYPAELPLMIKKLKEKVPILIDGADANPFMGELEKIGRGNFKTFIAVPIEDGNQIVGFVGCDSIKKHKKWTETEMVFLDTIANMMGIVLTKIKSEQKIEFLAYYDHLTGIPNRTLFIDRLSQAIQMAERNQRLLAVIFLDLDSFKIINDTKGHGAGDALLLKTALTLQNEFRIIDTVARFGGDEFLILANDLKNHGDVIRIMDKLQALFKIPFEIEGQPYYISASMGVAIYPDDGMDTDTLIKNADIAMYSSKTRGKNQYTLCTAEMKDVTGRNQALSNSLYGVVPRGELELFYQPQVAINNGEIIGVEALLRWHHPEFGEIRPAIFIPLSELNGTINNIGEWVLKKALQDLKVLHKHYSSSLRLAVNLSLVQFNNPEFPSTLGKLLDESQIDPALLELEITENIIGQDEKRVAGIIEKLKQNGVRLAIDDFGTDYSSLRRLRTLPIDRIKIDKQFVSGIDDNEKDMAIVNVIINLANNLKIAIIAEGVETEAQLDFLKAKGCDEVQGFYFYKPMPIDKLVSLAGIIRDSYKGG